MPSNLTTLDTALAKDVTFQFRSAGLGTSTGFNVKFQFPPRFLSDNRKGDWAEAPLRGDEPVAVYSTSGAREMTITWTYIAGARGGPGNMLFTPYVISKQLQGLRAYFASPYKEMKIDQALILHFRMWYHTGREIFTCRMKSLDVSFGKALVNDTGTYSTSQEGQDQEPRGPTGNPRRTYALRTDVTAEMRLWTKVAASESEGSSEGQGAAQVQEKIELPGLKSRVPPDWQ